MNIAVIPARGGSKRIPRKNVKLFHGKPILAYSIEAAQASGLFDSIYVSTDDEEAMRIAVERDCYIHVRSTSRLCGDEAGTQEVAQDCLLNSTSGGHEFACCIYPCAPMMDASDLQFGLSILKSVGLYRYVYMPGWYYWGRGEDFMRGAQITASDSLCLTPDPARWIDVNTQFDWAAAELMFTRRREIVE